MRRPRLRLRTLMIAVALSAMMLALAAPTLREWWAPSAWRITVSELDSLTTFEIDTGKQGHRQLLWRAQAAERGKPGTVTFERIPRSQPPPVSVSVKVQSLSSSVSPGSPRPPQ